MNEVLNKLSQIGIVPVIAIKDPEKAIPLAKALKEGGLPCAEITFRTKEGEEAIRRITRECPEILVGAGTVLTTEQVDCAIDAGAKFIVSPGLNPKVVQYCLQKNIPITPGCANPSDIEQAIELGLDTVKFFPAEQAGGINYIKAISAPYHKMMFMPTGGITQNNINDYLSFEKVLCCGGSWMVKPELIDSGNFDEITRLTKEAVKNMHDFELAHIGINTENSNEAMRAAKMFEMLFGFQMKEGNSSIFLGSYIEIMKSPFLGENGHIAISTNNIKRAVAFFEGNGFEFKWDIVIKDEKGNFPAIYFRDEIAGFAVHLLQKRK